MKLFPLLLAYLLFSGPVMAGSVQTPAQPRTCPSHQFFNAFATSATFNCSVIQANDVPTLNQNTSGNAATATALQTARTINGVSFDGTAPITVSAAAGTLTGSTLAAGVTGSSLTSFGAGIALGTPLSGVLTHLTGLPLTTGVTGVLPIANGGTGTTSPGIVQGTGITVTGSWPNQTVNATASGTVNSGNATHGAYYATSTTAVSDQPLIQFAADGVTIGTQAASANTINGTVSGNAVWTDTITVGSTSANGLVLQNTTAAATGAQQFSPRINLIGQGWKTNATAGSQSTSWIIENEPTQGGANPDANLIFSRSVNGGAYTNFLSISPSNAVATFGQSVSANGGNGNVSAGQGGQFNFTGRGILTSTAAGTVQLGAADATSPVAQTLKTQSQITTVNTAGQNWTLIGSLGTGTANGGSVIIQTGKSAGSGATANTATTALTIDGSQNATFAGLSILHGYTVSTLPTSVAGATAYVTDQLTTCAAAGAALTGSGSVVCPVFNNGVSWVGM